MRLIPEKLKNTFSIAIFVVGIGSWVLSFGYSVTALRESWAFAAQYTAEAPPVEQLEGTYRCWQTNTSGSCELPVLIVQADGNAELGDKKVQYTLENNRITIGSDVYTGEVRESGKVIVLKEQGGKEVTYLRQRKKL